MVVSNSFPVFFTYESSIIVVSNIELTVYTLDGFILDLSVSKYGFICM